MHPAILVLGAAVAFLFFKKSQSYQPTQPGSAPQNYAPTQPSQIYPWMPITPPRVDNQNQPWYNGPRGFMSTPSENQFVNVATTIQAGASVIHSLKDVWGDLSGIFGTDDPKSILMSTDSLPADSSEFMADSWDSPSGGYEDAADWDMGSDEESYFDGGEEYYA